MATAAVADQLERLASDLHNVAFDFREDVRSINAADARIAEVERICTDARAVVRGSAGVPWVLPGN